MFINMFILFVYFQVVTGDRVSVEDGVDRGAA